MLQHYGVYKPTEVRWLRRNEAYTVHEDTGDHRRRRTVTQAFVRFNQLRLHLLSDFRVQLFAKQHQFRWSKIWAKIYRQRSQMAKKWREKEADGPRDAVLYSQFVLQKCGRLVW